MKKDDLLKLYFKYRFHIFPAIVALSSLFLIVFAIYPQTMKLINNQKTIGDLVNRSKLLETKVIALESYNGEDLSQKAKYALASLPMDKDFLNILGVLQRLVTQSGFTITSISLGTTSGKVDSVSSFPVKLQVTGARVLFQSLLDNLENSPRLVRVGSIEALSGQAAQSVSVMLEIEVLYSQLSQNQGSIDTPVPELSQKDQEIIIALMKSAETIPSPDYIPSAPKGKANPFE